MTKTIRLDDLQLALLSSAAARDNGSFIPLPESCAQDRARIGKTVTSLTRRKLAEELPVTNRRLALREQDEGMFGLFITDIGRAAIGSEVQQDGEDNAAVVNASAVALSVTDTAFDDAAPATASEEAAALASGSPRSGSKIATVVALLERKQGATLDELVKATGWLPHTTRAALTGLRKKGRTIDRAKRGQVTCYRIVAEAVQ